MFDFRIDKYKNTPLYQNNPGNILKGTSKWLGAVEEANRKGKDKYVEFYKVELGIRALMRSIRTIMQPEVRTIGYFSRSYRPALATKKTAIYIKELTAALGVNENQKIALNKEVYITMAKTIARIEMGSNYAKEIPESSYIAGYNYLDVESLGPNTVVPDNNKNSNAVATVPNKPFFPTPMITPENQAGGQGTSTNNQPAKPKPTVNPKPNGGGNQQGNTQQGGNNLADPNLQNPYPTDPNSGQGSNVFLWVGVAIVLGTGGYLLYDHYAQKGKKK